MQGVPDPLRSLPTIYALHDVVELMVADSFEKPREREAWLTKLYAPPPDADVNDPPPGWSDEDTLGSFAQLAPPPPVPPPDRGPSQVAPGD